MANRYDVCSFVPYIVDTNSAYQAEFIERKLSHTGI